MLKLCIVGGGFAGLWAALAAAREAEQQSAALDILLVSNDEHLVYKPRLYEAGPEAHRTPLRPLLDKVGVRFLAAEVTGIDPAGRRIDLAAGEGIECDAMVLAAGSRLSPLPAEGAGRHGFNIDTYEAAVVLDRHLAGLGGESGDDGAHTVVIVGAGFTGIELACEMRARIAVHGGAAERFRIVLVDAAETVGPDLGPNPRPAIEAALADAGVETRLGVTVARIEAGAIELSDCTRIDTATTIVTAGVRASPLARLLKVELDGLGRLPVDPMLRVEGLDGVFAAGDVARAQADDEHLALMSCQHALTMGRYAGHNAACALLGRPLTPYRQPNYVTCLALGPDRAVLTRGWEREVVETGAKAGAIKRVINTERIYPPTGSKAELLAAAALPA